MKTSQFVVPICRHDLSRDSVALMFERKSKHRTGTGIYKECGQYGKRGCSYDSKPCVVVWHQLVPVEKI